MFHKYHHIDNEGTFMKKLQKTPYYDKLSNQEYHAYEKVHGCNFSFIYSNGDIYVARRSGILTGADKFYNHKEILKTNEQNMTNLFKTISSAYLKYDKNNDESFLSIDDKINHDSSLLSIQVYCELYGGIYNDTKKTPIQNEIEYAPNHDIIVYDILLSYDNNINVFINPNEVIELCKNNKIKVLEPLHVGDLQTMLNLDPKYKTTIPKLYHDLPQSNINNIAEGFVIKPSRNIYHTQEHYSRVIFKYKNDVFSESNNKTKVKLPKVDNNENNELMKEYEELFNNVQSYMTKTRYTNVLTKMTESEKSNTQKIRGLYISDVYNDVCDEYEYISDNNKLKKLLKQHIHKLYNEIIIK